EGRNSEIGTYDPCANLASARVRIASRWSSRAIAGLHHGGRHDLSSTQRSACSVWDRRHTAVLSHFIRQEKLHSFSIARREARTLHSASIISGRPGRCSTSRTNHSPALLAFLTPRRTCDGRDSAIRRIHFSTSRFKR